MLNSFDIKTKTAIFDITICENDLKTYSIKYICLIN